MASLHFHIAQARLEEGLSSARQVARSEIHVYDYDSEFMGINVYSIHNSGLLCSIDTLNIFITAACISDLFLA